MATCNHCGSDVADLDAFECNYCGSTYCGDHRLPERHDCPFQRVAESDGKHRDSRERTEFVRAGPIGHERKRPTRATDHAFDAADEEPQFDAVCADCKRAIDEGDYCKWCEPDGDRPELPTCEECGVVWRGDGEVCADCREATANESARDGSLASRSRVVADGGLPGERWRRVRWLKLRSWAYREVVYVVAFIALLHVLGLVDVVVFVRGVVGYG